MQNYTKLRPDHLRQCSDELRRGVAVSFEGLFVDHLAHGEPQCGFEALRDC